MATSAARPSLSRSLALTTMLGMRPASAEEARDVSGPVVRGYCSAKGIARSLSCCSTSIRATKALLSQPLTPRGAKRDYDPLGKDVEIPQITGADVKVDMLWLIDDGEIRRDLLSLFIIGVQRALPQSLQIQR